MKNRKCLLLIIFILISTFSVSQDSKELKEKYGFRNIKLNSNVENYVDENGYYEFVKRDSTNEYVFQGLTEYDYVYAGTDNNQIGNIDIIRIYVKTVDKLIYEIFIAIKPDLEIFDMMQLAYGKPCARNGFDKPSDTSMFKLFCAEEITCRISGTKGDNYFELKYYSRELEKKAEEYLKQQRELEMKLKQKNALKEF